MDGKGVHTWVDGRKYDGSYKSNKKNGHGTFTWANKDKYIGSWENGK